MTRKGCAQKEIKILEMPFPPAIFSWPPSSMCSYTGALQQYTKCFYISHIQMKSNNICWGKKYCKGYPLSIFVCLVTVFIVVIWIFQFVKKCRDVIGATRNYKSVWHFPCNWPQLNSNFLGMSRTRHMHQKFIFDQIRMRVNQGRRLGMDCIVVLFFFFKYSPSFLICFSSRVK